MTGALGPGIRSRTSKKLASKTRTNHSQALRGGIFGCPGALAAPRPVGRLNAPGRREFVFRCVCCPVELMVTSSRAILV